MLCDTCENKYGNECAIYYVPPCKDTGKCNEYSPIEEKVDDRFSVEDKIEDHNKSRLIDEMIERHRKERKKFNRRMWISEALHISAVVLVWYTVGKKVGIRKGYKSGLEMGKIIGRESILTELLSK